MFFKQLLIFCQQNGLIVSNSNYVEEYKLTDALGHVVWEGRQIENHNFSGIKLGLYFLKMKMKNSMQTIKLIKQ
jgi:hypothetical protein